MNSVMRHLILLSFSSLIFLGSCVVPESTHVEPDFFLLGTALSDDNQTNPESEMSFYINQVQLPRYLQDSRLVFRPKEESIEFRENKRWGEPLEEGIARVLGSTLGMKMQVLRFSVFPNRKKNGCDWEISLSVERFEKINREQIRLKVIFEIISQEKEVENYAYDSLFPILGTDEISEVRAMSAALDDLATVIAAKLEAS
tara:strand:+ start:1022 stop:1621 length:600 start_codon:yes stop_codon:yes gene_type:complete